MVKETLRRNDIGGKQRPLSVFSHCDNLGELKGITEVFHKSFSECERITMYAAIQNIAAKPPVNI